MANRHKYAVIFSGFVLLLLAIVLVNSSRSVPVATRLSVTYVGVTNDLKTGLCGMFLVRNVTSNRWVWFKTLGVEQKTQEGWQTFIPSSASWSGVEGSLWSPGYGCLYTVRWPPGLPTNAIWRLQVRVGEDLGVSGMRRLVNDRVGRKIFHSGGQDSIVPSTEVKQ